MDLSGTITWVDPDATGRLGASFERWITLCEVARYPRGRIVPLRRGSDQAVVSWSAQIYFLFIDGDHSWAGIHREWRDWSCHFVPGQAVALHNVPESPDLDSDRYTREVTLVDRASVWWTPWSLTVLERVEERGPQ